MTVVHLEIDIDRVRYFEIMNLLVIELGLVEEMCYANKKIGDKAEFEMVAGIIDY